ncbi:M20 metallopeptidase family protein [Maridesulfovibrio sp. FT414]|uniref:M20 metallopeptidase family protein n=1 Tax=Maridesulfovibrio sp. FT414 TaxID=2979469 RepID=UPI003D8029C5
MNLNEKVKDELPLLVSLYKHLHANPELSGRERNSAAIIAEKLEECGLQVTRNFGGYGVVGEMVNGTGPTIMVRADMDALPITEESGLDYASSVVTEDAAGNKVGVMHACGHDVHMAALIGSARVMSAMRGSWQGRILFVAQPAEESMFGARDMIRQGLFEKFGRPDFCLATHVFPKIEAGRIAVRPGPIMAGTFQLKLIVRGVGGHGAIPQESRDPVVLAARIITSLQTIVSREFSPLDPAVVTVGSIHGGTRSNIIPEKVELEVTARFFNEDGRNRILKSIERICRYEALSMDIPEELLPIIELDEEGELPATVNDSFLAAKVREAVSEQLGSEFCLEAEMVMGSEDFSLFRTALADEIPCCLFFTGATQTEEMELFQQKGINPPSLHNSRFCPPPEQTISTAVSAMCATILKLMS